MQAGGGSLAYGREGFEPSSCAVAGVLPPTIQLASVTGKITQMALLPGSIHMPPIFINCRALIIVSCHLLSWRHTDMKPNTLNWACRPSPTNVHTHMCIVKVKNNILGSILKVKNNILGSIQFFFSSKSGLALSAYPLSSPG